MAARGPNQYHAPQPTSFVHAYPPPGGTPPPVLHPTQPSTNASSLYKGERVDVAYRTVTRTPSPTPSEAEALSGKTRTCNLKKYFNPQFYKSPRNIFYLIVTLVVIGGLIAFVVLEQQILDALSPAARWLRETPGAWLIPIAIMVVMSFPPLFGHEFVALFCGDVWGLWIGFAIVAAGTIVGELATFFTFRYCCRGRNEKSEKSSLQYALLAEVIRQGGLKLTIMVRYSAIPAHMMTAIFASVGMTLRTFLIAAFVALPKQFASVYFGVAENSGAPTDENGTKSPSKTTKIIKIMVLTANVVITLITMRYVNSKIDGVKQQVIYARRKARQAKVPGIGGDASSSWVSFSQDDDAEAQVKTPFMAPSSRDSMDIVPTMGTPRGRPSYL
ncbi:hypothetical protein L227DRAFT_332941 [Lentinus tigrinus ALCF2SS1-6]|uniref:Golgi apparatus membrane protein TVP38 n=1 Tax=Lentinus tigrinus ALCF2SS1-6 TaxID=1328759 RepID=A0A5C2RUM9_9APHY|nr:hypothetical protein L227DRAFT_332941 [Lentinus tigrinus ALCF2SS1-6]